MSGSINSDFQLDVYAMGIAEDVMREVEEYGSDADDLIHEHVDGSEHVIYHYKSHSICKNCNTDAGEEFVKEVGYPNPVTYDSLASAIAFGELLHRVQLAYNELLEELI